jgi:hypothetical protein
MAEERLVTQYFIYVFQFVYAFALYFRQHSGLVLLEALTLQKKNINLKIDKNCDLFL